MGERRYQNLPYMVEGMYVVGIKPRSLGEGVVPLVYSVDYAKIWQWWLDHDGSNAIYQWTNGGLRCIGKYHRSKYGIVYHAPVPPAHMDTA